MSTPRLRARAARARPRRCAAATRRAAALGALAVALAGAPRRPAASPLGDPAIERAVFTGTTTPSWTSLLTNPAALAWSSGGHVHVDGTGTLDRVTIDRRTVDPDSGALLAGPPAITDSLAELGYGLGAWTTTTSRFAIGVQILRTTPEPHVDDDAFAYHARGGEHREREYLVGGAYRWNDLAFGVTLRFVQTRLRLPFFRDTALESLDPASGIGGDCAGAPCTLEDPAAREAYTVETDTSWAPTKSDVVAVTLGAVARIADGWAVGLAYQTPPGLFSSIETTGDVEVRRAPRDGGGVVRGKATVRFTLPQRLLVGVRGRVLPDHDLVVEGRWDRLSRFSRYDVRLYGLELASAGVPEVILRPRGLHDRFALAAGLERVDLGQRWTYGARLGLERGATPPSRMDALTPYPFELTADVGVGVRIAPELGVQLGYGVGWAPTKDTGRGAYDPLDRLDCVAHGLDVERDSCAAVRDGYAIPTASGTYGRIDQVVRISLWFTR